LYVTEPSRNRKTPTPLAKRPGRFSLEWHNLAFLLPEYVEAQSVRNDTEIFFSDTGAIKRT
jgi:hypothetical protein